MLLQRSCRNRRRRKHTCVSTCTRSALQPLFYGTERTLTYSSIYFIRLIEPAWFRRALRGIVDRWAFSPEMHSLQLTLPLLSVTPPPLDSPASACPPLLLHNHSQLSFFHLMVSRSLLSVSQFTSRLLSSLFVSRPQSHWCLVHVTKYTEQYLSISPSYRLFLYISCSAICILLLFIV